MCAAASAASAAVFPFPLNHPPTTWNWHDDRSSSSHPCQLCLHCIVYQCLGVELRCLSNRQVTLKSLEISTWPKRKHRITKWRRPCSLSTDRLTSHTEVCGLKQVSCFRPQSPKGRLGTQLLVAYRIFRSHMRAGDRESRTLCTGIQVPIQIMHVGDASWSRS